jgi:hypothetical protein
MIFFCINNKVIYAFNYSYFKILINMATHAHFLMASAMLSELFVTSNIMSDEELQTAMRYLQDTINNMVNVSRAPQIEPQGEPHGAPQQQREPHGAPTPTADLTPLQRSTVSATARLARLRALYSTIRPTEQLTTISVDEFNSNTNEDCSICHSRHIKGETAIIMQCNHEFGKTCLNAWFQNPNSDNKCPLCRTVCRALQTYETRI